VVVLRFHTCLAPLADTSTMSGSASDSSLGRQGIALGSASSGNDHLPTKHGQPSSSSPRTQSRRNRLSNIFSAFTSSSHAEGGVYPGSVLHPHDSSPSYSTTSAQTPPSSNRGFWEWLTPSKAAVEREDARSMSEVDDLVGLTKVVALKDEKQENTNRTNSLHLASPIGRLPDEM
jgi:hypothetical protein